MPWRYRRDRAAAEAVPVVRLQPFRAAARRLPSGSPCAPVPCSSFTAIVVVLLVGRGGRVRGRPLAVGQDRRGHPDRRHRRRRDDRPTEASAALRSRVLEPLNRPSSCARAASASRSRRSAPRSASTSTAPCAPPSRARARGTCSARAWRSVRGGEVDEDLDLSITYSEVAIDRLVERVAGKIDEPAVDADVDLESGDITPQASRGRAARSRREQLAPDVQRTLLDLGDDKTVRGAHPRRQAEGHDRGAREEVPGDPDRRPAELHAHALQEPREGQDLQRRDRRRRPRDARRALPHPEQGGRPRLDDAATPTGWRRRTAARSSRRGPANPLKARWLGIFDGAGIHGTDQTASIGTRRVARLHPHADPRRDRALRPGPGRRADLHRLARRASTAPGSPRRRPPATPVAAGRRGGRCGEAPGCR